MASALRAVSGELPALVGRTVWANLPLLLVVDVLVVLAALPAVAVALAGWPLFAPLVAGALVGPAWAAAVSVAGALLREDSVGARQLPSAFRRHGPAGLRIGLLVGAVATIAAGTLTMWDANPERTWLLVPLFVDGSVLALLAVGCLFAFPLAESGLRGRDLWLGALRLAAGRPYVTAGLVALVALAGLAVSWLPLLAVVLPGPFAVYVAATSSTSSPSVSSK
jgi:hypothetical protein